MKKNSIPTILTAGLTAALLDIAGAIVVYVYLLKITSTEKVLQSVAAGALGSRAYEGGWNTALAGLAFHCLIALAFAAAYYIAYPLWTKIFSHPYAAGFFYGIVIWCIMNLLVVPVATGKAFVFRLPYFLYGAGLVIFMAGLPIALVTHKMRRNAI